MNVGDFMRGAKIAAAKTIVTLAAWLVYIAGIVYAEIHGWSMMSRGVNPDFMLWAGLGMIALGITAIILPIGLHYAYHSALQRIVAFGFYALDLGILVMNAIIDFGLTSGGSLPGWAPMYIAWVVPATPVVAAMGWSLLLLLDPEQQEISMTESLKQSARIALAHRLAKKASREDLDHRLDQTADSMAEDLFSHVLGDAERRAAPRNVLPLQARPAPLTQQQPPAAERVPGEPVPADLLAAIMAAVQQHQTQTATARQAYAADIAQAEALANEAEEAANGQSPLS